MQYASGCRLFYYNETHKNGQKCAEIETLIEGSPIYFRKANCIPHREGRTAISY